MGLGRYLVGLVAVGLCGCAASPREFNQTTRHEALGYVEGVDLTDSNQEEVRFIPINGTLVPFRYRPHEVLAYNDAATLAAFRSLPQHRPVAITPLPSGGPTSAPTGTTPGGKPTSSPATTPPSKPVSTRSAIGYDYSPPAIAHPVDRSTAGLTPPIEQTSSTTTAASGRNAGDTTLGGPKAQRDPTRATTTPGNDSTSTAAPVIDGTAAGTRSSVVPTRAQFPTSMVVGTNNQSSRGGSSSIASTATAMTTSTTVVAGGTSPGAATQTYGTTQAISIGSTGTTGTRGGGTSTTGVGGGTGDTTRVTTVTTTEGTTGTGGGTTVVRPPTTGTTTDTTATAVPPSTATKRTGRNPYMPASGVPDAAAAVYGIPSTSMYSDNPSVDTSPDRQEPTRQTPWSMSQPR